jgi:hypothetical protein
MDYLERGGCDHITADEWRRRFTKGRIREWQPAEHTRSAIDVRRDERGTRLADGDAKVEVAGARRRAGTKRCRGG